VKQGLRPIVRPKRASEEEFSPLEVNSLYLIAGLRIGLGMSVRHGHGTKTYYDRELQRQRCKSLQQKRRPCALKTQFLFDIFKTLAKYFASVVPSCKRIKCRISSYVGRFRLNVVRYDS
jgi:hypothetical protein